MSERTIAQTFCQILRKKTNTSGSKSTIIGIGCLVCLPSSGLHYQDRLCILTRHLRIPHASLSRDCFAIFSKDKKISLKPERYMKTCQKLGFTLVACEQAKVMKDEQLKPHDLKYVRLSRGDILSSVQVSLINITKSGYTVSTHEILQVDFTKISFSAAVTNRTTVKLGAGIPLLNTDSELVGITHGTNGTALPINSILLSVLGFQEADGIREILYQLCQLTGEGDERVTGDGEERERLMVSACQALSKLAAKNGEDLELLAGHPSFIPLFLSPICNEPNTVLLGATCKLLTILTSPQTLTCQTNGLCEEIVRYVLQAMGVSQHASVHLFGCRVLLNLISSNTSEGADLGDTDDIRTTILDSDGTGVLRRVVRSHRDDKHIQHTVCLILSLLLEYTYRGWRESEEHREHCIMELEEAQELLSKTGSQLQQFNFVGLTTRLEEQQTALRRTQRQLENKEETIEQLHRRLEHALPSPSPVDVSKLEEENRVLKETLERERSQRERERESWGIKQGELEASLDFSLELVREMTATLRQVKCDFETESGLENKRVEYTSWGSITEELNRIEGAISALGKVAEEEMTYHYDRVDVGRDEDKQLLHSLQSHPDDKIEALRRFERTHSQTSLDISMDTEQKANKTLDKLQMVRKSIHGLERCLEDEEERLERLRQNRFVTQLHNIVETSPPSPPDVNVHSLPRGLQKHLCRFLDEAPACAWRQIVPLLGMGHRILDIEASLDSPTAELIRIWTNENKFVTFSDLIEVLRLAEQDDVLEFINKHLQLKRRLSRQSCVHIPS